MVIGKTGMYSVKSVPVPLCLPQIPHEMESLLLLRETGDKKFESWHGLLYGIKID
jgi:hypothetical protein